VGVGVVGVVGVVEVKGGVVVHFSHTPNPEKIGDPISAEEAYTFGFVNRVLETSEELETKTKEMAKKIASFAPTVIALGKRGFYQQMAEKDPTAAYGLAEKVMSNNACIYDAQEGISAFLEKRHPSWQKTK